jgi:hypothetical protein
MQTRTRLALAALGLAIAGALVFLASPIVGIRTGSGPATDKPRIEASAKPEPVATAPAESRVAIAPVENPYKAATDFVKRAKEQNATLLVTISDRRTGRPVDGGTVTLALRMEVKANDHVLTCWSSAGFEAQPFAGGRLELAVPADEPLHVTADANQPTSDPATVEVDALKVGERREVEIHVAVGDDLRYAGIVASEKGGRPIEGARVAVIKDRNDTFGEPPANLLRREPILSVSTRSDGSFEFAVASGTRLLARVEAEGFAPKIVEIGPGHSAPSDAAVIRLERASTLRVRVSDPRGGSVEGIEARASTRSASVISTIGRLGIGGELAWDAATDSSGRCQLSGLPPHAPLDVEILVNGKNDRGADPPLTLDPGEEREVTFSLAGAVEIHGRLVDQFGAPVPNKTIWLQRGEPPGWQSSLVYFIPYRAKANVATTRSDTDGGFILKSVVPGTWIVGPAPLDGGESIPNKDGIAPIAIPVRITDGEVTHDLVVTTYRDVFIRGRVVDVNDDGIEGCDITATAIPSSYQVWAKSGSGGVFSLGPLTPGDFSISSRSRPEERFASAARQRVVAPAADVVITRLQGATLVVRCIDAELGTPCKAEVRARTRDTNNSDSGTLWRTGESVQWGNLMAGVYDIVAKSKDRKIGVARNVRVDSGSVANPIEIRLGPAAIVAIDARKASGDSYYWVQQDGVTIELRSIEPNCRAEVLAPPGPLVVIAGLQSPKDRREMRVTGVAGQVTEVELGAK